MLDRPDAEAVAVPVGDIKGEGGLDALARSNLIVGQMSIRIWFDSYPLQPFAEHESDLLPASIPTGG